MSLKKDFEERRLDCPICFVEMDRKEAEVPGPNIEIDICPKCSGIWLDHGELNKLLRDRKLTDYLTKHIGTKTNSKLVCPKCGALMDIEKAEDVEIDVCLSCHGVWLDQGELGKLSNISKSGFDTDTVEKAEERWEDMVQKEKQSTLLGLLRRLPRR
ncbi:MAG: zf-TFIIB domain-containing protein [Halobacteriota archaeon]|nr:zf-TFIIB domain-containing protein [Halobacteriota archaeon]